MTALHEALRRHRVVSAILAVLLTLGVTGIVLTQLSHESASRPGSVMNSPAGNRVVQSRQHSSPGADPSPQQLSTGDRESLKETVARLRSMPRTTPATSGAHRPIRGSASQQPDLYAAEFARRLLTQDYRSTRSAMLAWVQSESAQSTEPTVIGLVPANLRDKLAVASVQEGFDGPGPVPAPGVWDTLADRHGRTSVVIQRVVEPVAWSSAVANGTITDPGVTAREVDAKVTLHTRDHGRTKEQRYSVALMLNLEGPPVRDHYGLVTVIRYKSVQVPNS